jgi:hypothetical protein
LFVKITATNSEQKSNATVNFRDLIEPKQDWLPRRSRQAKGDNPGLRSAHYLESNTTDGGYRVLGCPAVTFAVLPTSLLNPRRG